MNSKIKFLIPSLLIFVIFAIATTTDAFDFYRSLKLGDRGTDVKELQILLNSDPDTKIAETGVGSSGNETEYFGALTKEAVKKFQEKYRENVLLPLGLYNPTGYFGNSSIKQANELQKHITDNLSQITDNQSPMTDNSSLITNDGIKETETKGINEQQTNQTGPAVPIGTTPINNNISKPLNLFGEGSPEIKYYQENSGLGTPNNVSTKNVSNSNLDNFDQMKEAVYMVGREQGFSESDLDKAVTALYSNAISTTTDFMQEFERQMRETNSVAVIEKTNLFTGFVNQVKNTIAGIFVPKADAIGQSFGGMVFGSTFCTCSGNWLVFMMPLKPGGPVMITHYMGMQMYLNMNFPFSRYVLGFYLPAGAPCMMIAVPTCIPLPSQGMTTMQIGSA